MESIARRFPAGRSRGVTVAIDGLAAFVWFGWGQAAAPAWLVVPFAVGSGLGALLVVVAAAALFTGLASAVAPSTVTGAGAGLSLLGFALATLMARDRSGRAAGRG